MVQLTVYGHAKATCTQRVLILLEELELKYDFNEIDLSNGEHKEEEYLKLQPFGKIPVVKYGDRVLFESRSILRYIAKNNKEPVNLLGDVNCDIWLEAESQNFNPHASAIISEKVFKKTNDEAVIKTNLEALERVLDVYEKRLTTQEYIGGDSYSIVDISHIPYAYMLLKSGFKEPFKSRPNVYSWLKRIMRREAVRNVLEGRVLGTSDEPEQKN
jgi:glutathione S-transferase